MKKIILFAAILFSGVTVVNAQTSNEGKVNLTVTLHAVQSITVGGDVEIEYLAADDYLNGKDSKTSTTLNVVSAGGFAIRVQAEDLVNTTNAANTIAASSIAVTATAGDNGSGDFDSEGTLVKGDAKNPLITSAKGGVNKKYNVSYRGTGNNKYMENFNTETSSQSYTTVVTYTIAAS